MVALPPSVAPNILATQTGRVAAGRSVEPQRERVTMSVSTGNAKTMNPLRAMRGGGRLRPRVRANQDVATPTCSSAMSSGR